MRSLLVDQLKLIPERFDPSRVSIVTDTSSRVVQSANSFIEGFYPLKHSYSNPDLDFRIPKLKGIKEYVIKHIDIVSTTVTTQNLNYVSDDTD